MNETNGPYESVLKVFDFEEDAFAYMEKANLEKWRPINAEKYDKGQLLWINNKGEVIANYPGSKFFTLYKDIKGFERLISWEKRNCGLNRFDGFDYQFLENIEFIVDKWLMEMGLEVPARYSSEELHAIAIKCDSSSFVPERQLASVTAYCGQYLVKNISEYSWGLERRECDGCVDFVPYVKSGDHEFIVPYELLKALDKNDSTEFIWSGFPLDVIPQL